MREGEGEEVKGDYLIPKEFVTELPDWHAHTYVPVVMFLTPSPDTRTWRSFGCGRCVCGMLKMRGKA